MFSKYMYFKQNFLGILDQEVIKKMGDFIESGTHRGTNIKVKIEIL